MRRENGHNRKHRCIDSVAGHAHTLTHTHTHTYSYTHTHHYYICQKPAPFFYFCPHHSHRSSRPFCQSQGEWLTAADEPEQVGWQRERDNWCHKMGGGGGRTTVSVSWLAKADGHRVPEQADWVVGARRCSFGQSPVSWLVVLSLYREVEGSFLTRLWARKELSMGLSSGVGWEFFRAE